MKWYKREKKKLSPSVNLREAASRVGYQEIEDRTPHYTRVMGAPPKKKKVCGGGRGKEKIWILVRGEVKWREWNGTFTTLPNYYIFQL